MTSRRSILAVCFALMGLGVLASFLLPAQQAATPNVSPVSNTTFGAEYANPRSSGLTTGKVYRLQLDSLANLYVAQPAEAFTAASGTVTTATFTTPALAANGKTYDLFLTLASLAGTYTSCTVQPKVSADGVNYVTNGSAVSLTMSNGTAVIQTTQAVVGAWHAYTFACSAYGSAGGATLTEVFHQS